MSWTRVKCLLTGGHRRLKMLAPLLTLSADSRSGAPAGHIRHLQYDPCEKCGEVFVSVDKTYKEKS